VSRNWETELLEGVVSCVPFERKTLAVPATVVAPVVVKTLAVIIYEYFRSNQK
jgi:hypothetical protein